MGKFGQHAGVIPLHLLVEEHPGIFNDTGPRFVSSERRWFLKYSVPITTQGFRTHTEHRVTPPAGITNTSSSSNLVFSGGLPSRYWPAQPCLASVGNQSWAAGWHGCWQAISSSYHHYLCLLQQPQHIQQSKPNILHYSKTQLYEYVNLTSVMLYFNNVHVLTNKHCG